MMGCMGMGIGMGMSLVLCIVDLTQHHSNVLSDLL